MGTRIPLPRDRTPLGQTSDEMLVRAIGDGDHAAMAELFDRFQAHVFRFLARMIGPDDPELDDLVQMTFVEAHRASSRFRAQSAVKTWIFGIAANVARHHIRGKRRFRDALVRFFSSDHPAAVLPDARAEHAQLLSRHQSAVAALPHALRTAYVLCVIEETPCSEAARALGVREGTLWRRVHEARQAIRRALEGQP